MKVGIHALQVVQCDRLRQQLLVERQCKATIEVVSVKYGYTNNPTDEVEIRKVLLHIVSKLTTSNAKTVIHSLLQIL